MQPYKRLQQQRKITFVLFVCFQKWNATSLKAWRVWKTNTGLIVIPYLVRRELNSSVHINELKGHSKVLVAVSCERALGFGRIVHPGSRGGQPQSAGFTNNGVMFQGQAGFTYPTLLSLCRCSGPCPPRTGPCWWQLPQWTPSLSATRERTQLW